MNYSDIFVSNIKPIFEEFKPALPAEIDAAERRLKGVLPSTYKEILLKFGHLMFKCDVELNVEKSGREGVATIFGCSGEGGFLEDIENHPDFELAGLVPFADDLFNNRYVIHLNTGEVFFINYSAIAEAKLAAASFDEFLAKLEYFED